MKRTVALFLVLTFITAIFLFPGSPTTVYAEEYRNGFLLEPTEYDRTGIKTDTAFILKTRDKYSVEDITGMLKLLGDIPLKITQTKENEFLVKPEYDLEQNSLYTFVITTPEGDTVSWAFQTQRKFSVLGTLPAHQSSNVPVNSGIEIYFSHKNFGDIEKYFEISPKVEGRFETNGYAAVFIPKNLEPGTIYTVTIKKGLPLKGTEQKLAEDYVFAFETETENDGGGKKRGSLTFDYELLDFSTTDTPLIPINIYAADSNTAKAVVKTEIFRFNNANEFINAAKKLYEKPYWAYSSYEDNMFPTENLAKVSSFEQTFDLTKWQDRYLSFPEPLPEGFYLIQSTFNDLTAQSLVQSTDISAYYAESDTKTLFWVNDLKTGKPVEGATILNVDEGKTYLADPTGIAYFDTVISEPDEMGINRLNYYIVRKNGKELVLINNRYRVYHDDYSELENYWRYFQTDKSLYKPNDTVQFWGFLKNRYDNTVPSEITVEISEGSLWYSDRAEYLSYFLPGIQKPLLSLKIPAENGFFEGYFRLPDLSPGYYQITVKSGDDVLNVHYISVENYVKPAYKMTVEADKKAIFLNDSVNFTITPSFFDGTPLPFLDVDYRISGYPFNDISETVKTDASGKITIPFKAVTKDHTAQDQSMVYLNATASLPESGMINGSSSVWVFINDIYDSFETKTDDNGRIILEGRLNEIDIDKINNSEEEYWSIKDYLGKPVAGKKISGTVLYHTYDKIEDGDEYDYINKVVRKHYRYEERTESIGNFTLTTDEDGKLTKIFSLKKPSEGYYTAKLTWNDNRGRTMTREIYLSAAVYPGIETDYDWYHAETDKEKYRTGEEAVITLMNNEQKVEDGSFLFIEAQKGINGYRVQNTSEYKTVFDASKIPNSYVAAVYFNGTGYIDAGTANLVYDTDEKKINIEMKSDRESYRPGDTVNISITATDENKNPVPARVNIAIIDEAMLEISYYNVDVLSELYQWLGSGIIYSSSSHRMSSLLSKFNGNRVARDASTEQAAKVEFKEMSRVGSAKFSLAADAEGQVQVRSDFRDTALFRTITLNEDGKGTVSFKLPDNVTSWHVALAGISPDIRGGTGEASLKVTLPFFISDSMNYTYLKGDFPYIGVSAYGNDLKGNETITYQVTCKQRPDFIQTKEGKAFERVNIPLWQLDTGVYDIEIRATSENGLSDGIKRTIYVSETYHEIEKAVTDTLTANMDIAGGETGLTTLIFTDSGRGKLIPALYDLAYSGGSRLDQKYAAMKANLLLDELIPDRETEFETDVDLSRYLKDDGGLGILPYSESNVELSALLSGLLKDDAVSVRLKQYFYSLIFADPGRVNAPALYGLAVLGEPVLNDLKEAVSVRNLTLKDEIYLALAFEEIGEKAVAQDIYNNEISPCFEIKKPYIRVNTSKDPDTILKETALAAVLASKLDTPQKDGLYQYIVNNHSDKILVNIEKLLIITEELDKTAPVEASFTYGYDGNTYTEKITRGNAVTVKIPSEKLKDLKIKEASGNVSVTSVFKTRPDTDTERDTKISVKRTYYDYKTGKETNVFRQNDIVKVVIEWYTAPAAIDTYYEVTDFAPSGLKPIENPEQAAINPDDNCRWFRDIDGQKVTFNVFRDSEKKEPLVYYARVVSPGSFTADSTIIQGTVAKESINFGETAKIQINK